MTTAAWITLGLTWAVIGLFTVRFFLKVVTAGSKLRAPAGLEPPA